MKILIVCMQYSYGDPERELSFEYFNFYLTLKHMGYEVELFDYMTEIKALGKSAMNQKLLKLVREWRPTITLFSLFTDQFEPAVVDELRNFTKTICFFHDDTWRVDYSRFWAKYFDFFTTPDIHGEMKYREIGLPNAIYFPFGCNESICRNLGIPKKYDVSFVGGWHPYREWMIKKIKQAGISVEVFGYGWPNGEIDQEGMIRVFNESRINLNLTNSSSWDIRYLLSSFHALKSSLRSKKTVEQLKARIFEVNGCNTFQLSYFVEGLARCYEIEKEVAIYSDINDLIEKIQFYLDHEALRESIAHAAYSRTLQEHTYAQRFMRVFQRMGLASE